MASYEPVTSVMRSLELLAILNRQRVSTIDHMHRLTSLPKPTIVRLLETMMAAGYVARDTRGKGYQVTSQVSELSCGFHGAPQVVEAGRPWAQELTRMFSWPAAIAVLDRNAMLVCYTTSGDSPIAPYHGLIYTRLGLITKALGRAYLAFCPAEERKLIYRLLATSPHPDEDQMAAPEAIEAMICMTRKQQFAERQRAVRPEASSSVAVPIYEHGSERVLGTIGLTYYASAVKRSEIVERYVPNLQTAAAGISENVTRMQAAMQAAQEPVH
ncbi:DNA-binding transcriptional regulator [Frigidibacter albus]|uniref:DNA-binding transcriptional regulator n=1 Tax=Frigidibacter albus TaxID=1465486 RepID=A0A6L8VKR2_9RHOB|nr:DNA-binding transcriptional regulator [Frigidibacter albus]MZQ90955.1 DNA-binding transcriptional regulator [Frigidibacter albus]NBE32840.1 DNA-binding transcriptional regulator [Frigidibacter albus]GGH61771.1 IclR family transcriptional regulator [Frigidibacter albus]